MSGLEKMKFVAYQKVDYKEKVKRHSKFEVQINPDNFARSLSIDQPENKERGKKNSKLYTELSERKRSMCTCFFIRRYKREIPFCFKPSYDSYYC